MEYYEKNYKHYSHILSHGVQALTDPELMNRRKELIDQKKNPQSYFNFGFNIHDYCAYLGKHYFMRMERDTIFERMIQAKEEANNKMLKTE